MQDLVELGSFQRGRGVCAHWTESVSNKYRGEGQGGWMTQSAVGVAKCR